MATISAAAELKAQVISKEIEVNVLQNYVGTSHSEFQRAVNELRELEKKYEDMVSKRGTDSSEEDAAGRTQGLFLRLEEVPEIGVGYARLYREVVLQEKIMEFLLPLYEQAKIQEAKDTPTVQVLDEAVIPIKKHRPKRAIMVVFFGMLSVIFSVLYWALRPSAVALYEQLRN